MFWLCFCSTQQGCYVQYYPHSSFYTTVTGAKTHVHCDDLRDTYYLFYDSQQGSFSSCNDTAIAEGRRYIYAFQFSLSRKLDKVPMLRKVSILILFTVRQYATRVSRSDDRTEKRRADNSRKCGATIRLRTLSFFREDPRSSTSMLTARLLQRKFQSSEQAMSDRAIVTHTW